MTRTGDGRLVLGGLRTRLTLVTMLITGLVVAGVVVAVQLYLAQVSDSDSLHLARARADAVAGTVRVQRGQVVVLEAASDSLDRNVWVFDGTGRLVEGRLPTDGADVVAALGARPVSGPALIGDRVRLAARPVLVDGRRVAAVVAGVELTPYEDSERRGLWLSLGLGLLTVLAAGVAAREAARHTLGQVRHMVRSAQDWEEHDLERRFAMGEPVDEITELGRTLDHMLDRISEALHAERRLSDEMAHELRTPLTVIRAEAELALARAEPAGQESLRSIVEAAERVDAAVGSMLDAARSRHDTDAVVEVVQLLRGQTVPPESGITLVLPPARRKVRVAAPAAVVQAALIPLLHNAVRHARSRVELTVAQVGDRVLLSVLDDGPGVSVEEATEVFRPGHSGPGGGVAGLGLSVVRRLVESVDGAVRAQPGDGGRFEIELPAAE